MDDVDKIVAAVFTAQMCSDPCSTHADYLEQYEIFLRMIREREMGDSVVAWEKPGGKE